MIKANRFRPSSIQLIVALVCLILAGVVFLLINRWWMVAPLLPVILIGFHYRQRLTASWQAGLVGLMLAVILVSSINGLRVMQANIAQPPEWDILAFWLNGRVAAQGLNFYEPKYYQELARPFKPSEGFNLAILSVGFWYPPPTIFLFLPLGWFEIHTAILLWYIANGGILILDIILLWKIFLSERGLIGLVLIATLVLALRATLSTIALGQTNFIVLLWILLFWHDRERQRGGIWLALGIITKPFLALIFLYLLLRRSWGVITSTIVTLMVTSLICIAIFGPTTFFSYFTANPTAKMPDYVYTEPINQSLLATILRLTDYDFSHTSPVTQPIFVVLAFILLGITAWLVYRLNSSQDVWALGLIVTLALLVYPASLEHYSILLVAPLLMLWTRRQEFRGGIWGITAFITLTYLLVGYQGGNYVFVANALNWLALTGISVWVLMRQPKQPASSQLLVSSN